MTPTRYRECLDAIGWSGHQLAAALGVHETRTRRWGTGVYPIPEPVGAWLEALAACHAAHAMPEGWAAAGSRRTADAR